MKSPLVSIKSEAACDGSHPGVFSQRNEQGSDVTVMAAKAALGAVSTATGKPEKRGKSNNGWLR